MILTTDLIGDALQRKFSDRPGVKHIKFVHGIDIDGRRLMRVSAESETRIGYCVFPLRESDLSLSLDEFMKLHLIPAAEKAIEEMK